MTIRQKLLASLSGYQRSALYFLAAELAIPDRISAGHRTLEQLAVAVGANEDALRRILRALVVAELLVENDAGELSLTEEGELLRDGVPGSLRPLARMIGLEYMPAWSGLVHSARTGTPAFDHVFGMSPWQHREQHPEINASFNAYLARELEIGVGHLVRAYDYSKIACLADVGGGNGTLLTEILRAHPKLRGMLVDQAHVVAGARPAFEAAGLMGRCELVAANFFEAVPAGADAYLMKSVLHDWTDEQCVQILRQCRAVTPSDGRLLLIERIVPERAHEAAWTIMLDIHMLAVTGGRERTRDEHAALLERGGYELVNVSPTPGGDLLEAVPR